ncbi:LamG-like jellyroll fold domain-containing protein [Kitasatospora sp. NBC_01266]|uniref:LamG-like jellyroll fold domain-containing protein n=1 Tax=Kitasatospora sp. NBC_01266 TaxID=2903572 RepID=UPI002E314A9D|nr:LamG-like jellyroll fold domain-containing protein [Kitasatospora sp. NBC_01266]
MAVVASAALGTAPVALASPASPVVGSGAPIGHPVPVPQPPAAAQPKNLAPMEDGQGPTAAQQAAMTAAVAQAHSTGKPVVVDALTTETQETVAQPKGGFALTSNPKPVRTKKDGAWTAVDTTLRKGADGTLAPAATAYGEVRFSGGGKGPLAVTTSGGTSYTVNWPAALPVPTVSGSTATYPEVLPGVDLVLSATDGGGFSDVLVVKNAQAAKNPALASLKLATSVSGGKLVNSKAQDGISIAGADGATLDSATPLMWDSNTALPAASPAKGGAVSAMTQSQAAAAKVAPDASDVAHPGAAAHISLVRTKASADSLTLVPDAKLLGDPGTVFPAYLDPTFNWHPTSTGNPAFDEVKQGSPCNGSSLFDNTGSAGDGGQLGVGVNGWSTCRGAMRTYYQWQLPTVMWGADVQSGTVNATKVYSASCSENPTVDLHWAGGIGSGTSWNNQPGYGGVVSSTSFGPSYNASYCPGNGSVTHGLDVTGAMQQSAAGHWGQFTGVLTEDGYESSNNDLGFSRFSDNPTLQIEYNQHPNTPGASDLSAVTGADNAGCALNTPYPLIGKTIASNTPVLRSVVSDPDGDSLQATFKYWVDGSSTSATGLSGDNLGSGSTAMYSLPSSFVSSLTDGQTVDWQSEVTDGEAWSSWSPVCHFTAYPTGPDNPTVAANSTFPNTDNGGLKGAAAGTTTTFAINSSIDGGAPTTKVIYGLDQQPATSNTPANETATVASSAAATPAGRWLMNDNTGNTGNDSAGGHPVTFQAGSSWSGDSTRGTVVSFNGSNGYGATSGPVLNTSQSFSVAAWVKLNSLSSGTAIVSQSGTNASNFFLYYSPWAHSWAFAINSADATTNSMTAIYGPNSGSSSPQTGVWAQVAGVYNAGTQQMQLYVNGTLAASGAYTGTTWNAAGALQVGRDMSSGSYTNYANGSISDLQVYQRALTADEAATINSSASVSITPLSAGPHTLWAAATDAAGDLSGMTAYRFLAAGDPSKQCASFAACLNNTAISPDGNTGLGAADGMWGHSFSANDLANAGWNSGQHVTVNGATFTLPAYGAGQADNILAANQTIPLGQATADSAGSALVFLATSTIANLSAPGAVPNAAAPYVPAGTAVSGEYCFDSTRPSAYCPATGTVTYSDGSTQSYALVVPDWIGGPSALAAVTLPHWNTSSGQTTPTNGPKLYPFSVPLTPGKTPVSVTLPDVGTQASGSALHVFGLATRNTTTGTAEVNGTTVAAPANQSWTATWGSPTVGDYGWGGSGFSNQTVRVNVKPSVSGNTVRIKLDDAVCNNPMVITHATVAVAGSEYATAPTGATTNLTFAGSAGVTVPGGGMVYSDPLPYPVNANQYLQVSFSFSNSIGYVPMNPWANTAWTYMSAPGSGDKTTDTTGTPFTGTGTITSSITSLLTDVDVTTANVPAEAVMGDGLVDPGTPGTNGVISTTAVHLAGDLAAAAPTSPTPFSTIDEGVVGNMLTQDFPPNSSYGGPSALSRIDRDILDQPGLNTVVLDEGLMDVLHGQTANSLTTGALTQLLTYLQSSGINVTAVGLTPCDGYAGDGVSGANDPCTSTVDGYRTTVNRWLSGGYPLGMGPWSTPALNYIDPDEAIGWIDSTNGEIEVSPNATVQKDNVGDAVDNVNLTSAGYGGLANAILGSQDTWLMHDAAGSVAADTASSTGNAYLANNPAVGQNPITLSGGYSWTTGANADWANAVKFDGTTGYGATAGPVINTGASFTLSAGVVNFQGSATDVTLVAVNGVHGPLAALKYSHATNTWCFDFAPSDGAPLANNGTCTANGSGDILAVGTYDATSHTASLYLGDTFAGSQTGISPWVAGGSLTVGADLVNGQPADFLPGPVTQVQAWNYALTGGQAQALGDGLGVIRSLN